MKVVISSVGSRGDVQPIIALGLALQAQGHQATLCLPPNFREWVESRGLRCVPLGQDLRKWTQNSGGMTQNKKSKRELRKQIMAGMRDTVREQFSVTREAAEGCDLIVVANGIQAAGSSIAELMGIPYVFTTYCPGTLKSSAHPPPMFRWQNLPRFMNRVLWALSEKMWRSAYHEAVNVERKALGLPEVENVPALITTDTPWIAADRALAPAAPSSHKQVTQTGAWLLEDTTPLPHELEAFLTAGEKPVYIGFGSMWASRETNAMLLQAARAAGRRVILSKGWGELDAAENDKDCIAIGEVSHQQLFPRVAAVVHHGGAGTTTAAALAGVPQVIVPHVYDQYYWAHRVQMLGIGVAGPRVLKLSAGSLTEALSHCLQPGVTREAQSFSHRIMRNGAEKAAALLTHV